MEKELKENLESRLNLKFESREIEEGLNTIYVLESEEQDYILKLKTNEELDEERFKAEPTIYETVNQQTGISSPKIVSEDIEGESRDFYVMEKIEGKNLEERKEELNAEDLEGFLRQFGRILGEIHRNTELDKYGLLCYSDGELGTLGDDDSWKDVLRSWIDSMTERIYDEWENPPEIHREKILEKVEKIPGPEPVLMHLDNRLENIIVRDGEINGLVDWSYSGAGDKYFDLLRAEYLIIDYDLTDRSTEVQNEMREALLNGYISTTEFDEEVYEVRRGLYRTMTTLWLMAGLPNWGSGFNTEKYEKMEQNLKQRLGKEQP